MNLKERITNLWNSDSVIDGRVSAGVGATIGGAVLLFSAVTSGLYWGFSAGVESLQNTQEKEVTATVVKKNYLKLHSGAEILSANIVYDGHTMQVRDGVRVLNGDFFSNDDLPKVQVNKTYKFSLVGNDKIGYSVIDVK